MSDQFVGQLLLVGFNFAPYQWASAAGQLLPISSNTALFSLLGTFYGGDGRTNFALPNLQGAVALGIGQGAGLSDYQIGETGGTTTVSLNQSAVPAHNHLVQVSAGRGNQSNPVGNAVADAKDGPGNVYTTSPTPVATMSPTAVSSFGGGQPHNNLMPYQALNWIIALQGVFPPRS